MKRYFIFFYKSAKEIRSFPAPILLMETLIGIALSIFSFIVFIDLRREIMEKESTIFDNSIWHFFYSLRNPFLTEIMLAFTFLGGVVIVGLAVCLSIFFFLKKHKREAYLLSFLFAMSVVIDNVLKVITQRIRPNISPLIAENVNFSNKLKKGCKGN